LLKPKLVLSRDIAEVRQKRSNVDFESIIPSASAVDVERAEVMFGELDTECSGTIEASDLLPVLLELGINVSTETLSDVLGTLGITDKAQVSFPEALDIAYFITESKY
jgi:Ca2+-binding EF-hand superfamily protein